MLTSIGLPSGPLGWVATREMPIEHRPIYATMARELDLRPEALQGPTPGTSAGRGGRRTGRSGAVACSPRPGYRPRPQECPESTADLDPDERADRVRNGGRRAAEQNLAHARVERRAMGQAADAVSE
jgi:hypothetical protein